MLDYGIMPCQMIIIYVPDISSAGSTHVRGTLADRSFALLIVGGRWLALPRGGLRVQS